MKIHYVEHKSGKKLFSFHRHDYKCFGEGDDFVSIDGGLDSYIRYSGTLKEDYLAAVFEDVRQQMTWGKNLDKEGKQLPKTEFILLKDIETDHLEGILKYFLKNNLSDSPIFTIFAHELEYRKG